MKDLTVRQIAAIKRQFKNSLPALKKIESINKKIAELEEEKKFQQAIFDGGEAGIIAMTGGYRSTDLINCEYVPQFNEDGTPKMDKDGKYQLRTQVLTFIPPVEAIENAEINNVDTDQASEPADVMPAQLEGDNSFPFVD